MFIPNDAGDLRTLGEHAKIHTLMSSPTLHPEAQARFDADAARIKAQVVRKPHVLGQPTRFKPEWHISGDLRSDDLSEIAYAEYDIQGHQTGYFIRQGATQVGLTGEGFRAFLTLTIAIQRTRGVEPFLSTKFIREALFKWAITDTKNEFSPHLLKLGTEATADQEVWIPIAGMYVESSIDLGVATIRTFTKEMIANTVSTVRSGATPEQQPIVDTWSEKLQKDIQGIASAVVLVRAEPTQAMDIAAVQAELAIDILRFFARANRVPGEVSMCAPLGSEPRRSIREFIIKDNKIWRIVEEFRDVARPAVLANSDISQIRAAGLDTLAAALKQEDRSEFTQTVIQTVALYSRGALMVERIQRLLYQFAALEGLMLKNTTEPIQQNLSERMAFFATADADDRERIIRSVKGAYDLRSRFLHHASGAKDDEALAKFAHNAWQFLGKVIRHMHRYPTRENFLADVDAIKFGRTQPPEP